MSSFAEQLQEVFSRISRLQTRTHAAFALVGAAIVEETLAGALLSRMRPLSEKMKEKLFDGYGPLSTFASRIDVSYALQIITKEMHHDLRIILKIRNAFAHSVSVLDFNSPEIREFFTAFKAFDARTASYLDFYIDKLRAIDSYLERLVTAEGLDDSANAPA